VFVRLLSGIVAVTAISLAGNTAGPVFAAEPARVVERAFAPGGQVTMELAAGKYVVQGAPDPRIRLSWNTRDPRDASKVWTRVETSGTAARIETDGPHNGFEVTIQVPFNSDLTIRLSAGDLTIAQVAGNKDVSAWAGDMKIDVPKADDYKWVDASVTAGDLKAGPFGIDKGGLFRSFTWTGRGTHDMRVRLTAGKIVMRDAAAER
jgi:hypothetical protein